ncbi:MAG: DUF4623 domain-containing protein [Planctomycetota bacterium]
MTRSDMPWKTFSAAALVTAGLAMPASAALNDLQALTSFSGDGWLSPAEAGGDLASANLVRSMAFNSATGNVLFVDRNTVEAISGETGAVVSTFDNTGVGGGTFNLNALGVTDDGVVYASNLTTNSTTSPLRIYRWADESSVPTAYFVGDGGAPAAGVRLGDALEVDGPDATGQIAAGFSGAVGFGVIPTGAATPAATGVSYAGTAPNAGDYRLGITFADADTVLGTQGTSRQITTFTGSAGVLDATVALTSASERGMDYAVIDGEAYLATIDTVSNLVRLYDATDVENLVLLDSENLTTSTASNGNGTSAVSFGVLNGDPVLYALNTNNGIQAFSVVPEPATAALLGLGGLAMLRRRGA